MIRPNSTAARDVAYHLHAYTNLRKNEAEGPLVLTKGKGVYVYDDDGKEYIEGLAGLWCTSLGYGEERLVEAAASQMRRLAYTHVFAQKTHDVAADLAERLIKLTPGMSKAFFNNSGSEANDTAIKIVWYYNNALGRPRKKKIIARMKGYHGVTVATASLTGLPTNHVDFDLPIAQIRHADCPHHWRFAHEGESEEQFASRLAENLDLMIQREGPDTVAAFIAEPVMGAGGVLVPPKTYFEKIQAVLKKYDVLLIADEVICGFGRTGNMFGSETFGIEPDMMTMAKALSSAYLPISATLVNDKIYQAIADRSAAIGTFGHGYTYSGHPVAAAVAVETLKIYEERKLVARVRELAPRFQEALRKFAGNKLVGEARGIGLIGALELVPDKRSKAGFQPAGRAGAIFAAKAQENGLICRNLGDAVALCPPLVISESQIDEMMRRFGVALDATARELEAANAAAN
jgi:4-aminobutyrate---pyruvate transaminase